MNILKVHGSMNVYLALELLKILLVIPVLFLGIYYGMKAMLVAIIIHTTVSFLISARFSGRIINYGFQEYSGELSKLNRYKFSKLKQISNFNFKPIFLEDGIIFFDKKFKISECIICITKEIFTLSKIFIQY